MADPLLTESTNAGSAELAAPGVERRSWISGLLRLLTLRHAYGMKDAPAWLAWLLGGLALLVWTGVDRLRTGPDAMFITWGAPGVAWYVLMLLAVAAALSSRARPRGAPRRGVAALPAGSGEDTPEIPSHFFFSYGGFFFKKKKKKYKRETEQ